MKTDYDNKVLTADSKKQGYNTKVKKPSKVKRSDCYAGKNPS
jgi:hypothetical protein